MEFALKCEGKQGKNGKFLPTTSLAQWILKRKFPSLDKPLRIQAPPPRPKISPLKRAFEKYRPRGLITEFYSIFMIFIVVVIMII